MSDYINLRKATSGDSLSKLISEKLQEENNGKKVDINNSVWNQILDLADEQNEASGTVYAKGKERKNWHENYVIYVGQVVSFSKEIWNKIKALVGINSTENVKTNESSVSANLSANNVTASIDLTSGDYASCRQKAKNGTEKYVLTVDGKNARYKTMDIEYDSQGNLIGYIQHYDEGDMAFDANNNRLPNGVFAVKTYRNEQQQTEYKQALDNAKSILKTNAENLGLSAKELELIDNIQIESINYGAARFDRDRGVLLFNINDENASNKSDFVKIIIHELTHATQGNTEGKNSQAEESMCETRAIKSAVKLIQQNVIDDFEIPANPPINISSLSTDEQIDLYVKAWLEMCGYTTRLPETI